MAKHTIDHEEIGKNSSSGVRHPDPTCIDVRKAVALQGRLMANDTTPDHAPPGVQCPCAACFAARQVYEAHRAALEAQFARGLVEGMRVAHEALAREIESEILAVDISFQHLLDECAVMIATGGAVTPILQRFFAKVKDYGYRIGHNDRTSSVVRRLKGAK